MKNHAPHIPNQVKPSLAQVINEANQRPQPNEQTTVVPVTVMHDQTLAKTVSLADLKRKNVEASRKQTEAIKKANEAKIAGKQAEILQLEATSIFADFEDMCLTYKVENSLPLDLKFHLDTGQPIANAAPAMQILDAQGRPLE